MGVKVSQLMQPAYASTRAEFQRVASVVAYEYNGLITQALTAAPVLTEIDNSYPNPFTITRDGPGQYKIECADFTIDKTLVFIQASSYCFLIATPPNSENNALNSIYITIANPSTTEADNYLTASPIKIQTYS